MVTTNERPILGELGLPTVEGMQVNNMFLQDSQNEIEPEKLHLMFKTDGQIAGLWRLITTPIRSSHIQLMRADKRGNREYDFIHSILFEKDPMMGMKTPLEHVISTALRMLIDGWAPHEIVWKIDPESYVRVDKIAYRSPTTIKVKLDRHGEIMHYIQEKNNYHHYGNQRMVVSDSHPFGDIMIPKQKVLHFVYGYEWNNVFGRSFFLQAYYHFEKKHKLYYISHLAAQIEALRLRILQAPQSATRQEAEQVMSSVSRLGFNSTIQIPDGFILEFPDLGSNNNEHILSLIQHHDTQMSKSVLSEVLDIGVEGRTGSFNLSDTHVDIFILNLELISKTITDIINRDVIPKLIDWNFGTDKYPQLTFLPFDKENRNLLASLFTRIVGAAQVNISPEFKLGIEEEVSKILKIDIDYDEVKMRDIDNVIEKQELEMERMKKQVDNMDNMQQNNMNGSGQNNNNQNNNRNNNMNNNRGNRNE